VKIMVSTMSGKQISNPVAWSLFEIVFMLLSESGHFGLSNSTIVAWYLVVPPLGKGVFWARDSMEARNRGEGASVRSAASFSL
jgi:hypothetical protein